jgi:hypothetical protein
MSELSFPSTADEQSARIFTSIPVSVRGLALVRRAHRPVCIVIYCSTKGRSFPSPEARYYVVRVFGWNYFVCVILYLCTKFRSKFSETRCVVQRTGAYHQRRCECFHSSLGLCSGECVKNELSCILISCTVIQVI